jgi:NDP-sugar pyrophosphorylase family protein
VNSLPPALVLAAGRGVRLDPLTRLVAKPAVPFRGCTLIEHVIEGLARQGLREIVVNLHHLPHTITGVVGDGRQLGVRVRYSWEQPVVLGSAGGPRHALPLLDAGRLVIVNSDTLCEVDVRALIDEHCRTGAEVTLSVIPNPAPDRYGGVLVDDRDIVTGFTKKGNGAGTFHFVGVQVANASIFEALEDGEPIDSVGRVYREAITARPGSIRAWKARGSFVDVGTPRDYFEAARIADAGSIVWPQALVDPGSHLERCIVTTGVSVPPGFRATDAMLLPASFARDGDRCEIRDGIAIFPIRT